VTPTRRRVLASLLGLVGVLTLAYVTDLALTRNRLPRGTRVAGVAIGGKTVAQARRIVAARVHGPAQMTVTGPAGAKPLVLDAAAVGLGVDAERTVDHALGQTLNPVARVVSLFGTRDVSPVPAYDTVKLRDAVRAWAAGIARTPREGSVRFDGITPVGVPPRSGLTIDVDATAGAVGAAYPGTTTVPAKVATVPVRTTQADVTRAVDEIARPAVAADVLLHAPRADVPMSREQIAAVLRIKADASGRIVAAVDRTALDDVLKDALKPVETPPKDAPFTVDDAGHITIGASAPGTKVDRDALARDLLPELAKPAPRTVALAVTEAEPRITTALAKTLGIKEKVGEFTTYHPCCRARVTNIHRIADIVTGAVVLPGETFSLNAFVGPRDTKRGFVMAPMILDGKFVPAVGGGVSQFATTMFNAVFFGGFADVSHKPHSYYISRYPAGREATVSSPTPDLQWKDDSKYGVLITTKYTDRSITVTFWSTKRYDVESVSSDRYRIRPTHTVHDSRPTCEPSSGEPGFDIDVWRVFTVHGKEVRREKFHTRYLPEPRFVCG
jgi:vancomycin resistance protein YoaR